MNGPVAMAGSIPLLSKNRGMKVPIIPATIITITNEIEIARATKYSSPEIIINKNKIEEFKSILKDFKVEIRSLSDFGPIPEAIEDGDTFDENAPIEETQYDDELEDVY